MLNSYDVAPACQEQVGRAEETNRKGQDLFKDDRHKDMIGKAWVNAGCKRSSDELERSQKNLELTIRKFKVGLIAT